MKPFNLQEAMAGKPVQTRDGREVTQLKFFEDVNINLIIGVVAKNIWTWNMEGQSDSLSGESNNDLFMALEKKSIWVNVYEVMDSLSEEFELSIGKIHGTKESAMSSKNKYYIKTIEITNEI